MRRRIYTQACDGESVCFWKCFFFLCIIMEVVNTGRHGRIRVRICGAGGHRGVTGTRVGTASKPCGAIIPQSQDAIFSVIFPSTFVFGLCL